MKKCKLCKELKVREFNGIGVSKFCVPCRKIKEQEKKDKKKLTKTYQKAKYKTLHKKAWILISAYVRQQGADSEGFNHCYTCGNRFHYKEMHCSHFHHNKLDFDLRNLKACCVKCNTYMSGNLAIYATKLARELGVEGLEELKLDSNTISYTNEDLEVIIEQYKERVIT
jgi:hypothetical protein